MGLRLRKKLEALASRHPVLAAIRSAGLLMGVEIGAGGIPDAPATSRIVNGLRDEGVLISSCGKNHNVLKIRPPLIIGVVETDLFAETLGRVMDAQV